MELALSMGVEDSAFAVRSLFANLDGVLIESPRLFPRGTRVDLLNPANGVSLCLRVVWSWVDEAEGGKSFRLALERAEDGVVPWLVEYERRLSKAGARELERRRFPRRPVSLRVEVRRAGARQFGETFDVSERGAGVILETGLEPGTLLHLVRPDVGRHTQMRVIWSRPKRPDESLPGPQRAGLEMVAAPRHFWNGPGASP